MHPASGIFLCLVFAILHKQQITMYICKCVMQKKVSKPINSLKYGMAQWITGKKMLDVATQQS